MNGRRQVVITKISGKRILLYMENEKIYDVLVESVNHDPAVGNIYVGKVQNIVKNISAAFVEVQKGVLCYLPLSECAENPVKCGDEIVVQVKKAAVKTKQAVVTRFPELVGRFCVVSTGDHKKGISKKISDPLLREKLLGILDIFQNEPYGLVLRTAAQNESPEIIEKECKMLLDEMHEKMEHSKFQTCFSMLRGEVPFYFRYLYGCQPENLDRIITDDREIFESLQNEYSDRDDTRSLLSFYEDDSYSLDKLLGISVKLEKALEKRVWLKSGGNLVIEPTEALTVIDVNTGKAIEGRRNKETTFFQINCEAAREAARQIRLRNISGIILIDFIDMRKKEHQIELMTMLRQELQKDKTRTSLVDITKLGLVEITRMKLNPPLWEVMKNFS